jgi:NAD(P)-dependent dehydrogenase (short-subunit alcohol dehydrogenase family)
MMGGTANAALINFTKALADLGARSKVLVTGVSAGPVKTERWDSLMLQQARAAGQDVDAYVEERSRERLSAARAAGGSRQRRLLSRERIGCPACAPSNGITS